MEGRSPSTAVLTISDRCARGEQIDRSGPEVAQALATLGRKDPIHEILPDDEDAITRRLTQLADGGCELILTTGGTGLSPRDRTPEATMRAADRLVPGLGELMRSRTGTGFPRAYLSRGLAAARGRCLIVNLPGSPRGAVEMLLAIADLIPHAVDVLNEVPGGRNAHDSLTRDRSSNTREADDGP
jgi:molybdenum cofactor synthesis domain-containing protein